jgi:hypothetical protein
MWWNVAVSAGSGQMRQPVITGIGETLQRRTDPSGDQGTSALR